MLSYYNLLDKLELETTITENPYGFKTEELFLLGARVNPKRSFLFISKLLGKHLSTSPDIPKATGQLLAELFAKEAEGLDLNKSEILVPYLKSQKSDAKVKRILKQQFELAKKTLFIGFAETATGLGHAVSSAFKNSWYIHTTREELSDIQSVFDFEEEHSHATDHRCYLPDKEILTDTEHIVLIDDEMTTGKTSLNLIRSLHSKYPKNHFTILCLLDWRTNEQREMYKKAQRELGIQINVLSLVKGSVNYNSEAFFQYEHNEERGYSSRYESIDLKMKNREMHMTKQNEPVSYLKLTGRFGMDTNQNNLLETEACEIGERLKEMRKHEHTLVIGTGEFMYIPSRIASYMGDGVEYKSTTRSPIYPNNESGYPIKSRIQYKDQDDITHYLYNLNNEVKEMFVLTEKETTRSVMEEMTYCFRKSGIETITFIRV